ncbi:hypothetical protein HK104_006669 [Borealophlyctis nickersoniae]|nr:hypothetical protein HK104_006669 [Borealophlyctis nickersoniae]
MAEKMTAVTDDHDHDDLKTRLRARRAAAGKKGGRKGRVGAGKKSMFGNIATRAFATEAVVGIKEVVGEKKEQGIVRTVALNKPIKSVAAITPSEELKEHEAGSTDYVRMSIYLYGPPAWEFDTLQPHPRARLRPSTIAELRRIANIHHAHLHAVARVLEALMCGGATEMEVVEEEGGVFELNVTFEVGVGVEEVERWLEGCGVRVGEGGFEVVLVKEDSSTALESNHRPDEDVTDFLAMVDGLIAENRSFGRSSVLR